MSDRYKASPILLFAEEYILDVLGVLPAAASERTQAMNLQKVFKAKATDWRDVIAEVLHFSPTFPVAVLDRWFRDPARDPRAFAMEFIDAYTKEGSGVDVWPEGALEAAKAAIRAQPGGAELLDRALKRP